MTITDFMPNGLEFVHSLLVLAGSLLAASGVALWIVETGPGKGRGLEQPRHVAVGLGGGRVRPGRGGAPRRRSVGGRRRREYTIKTGPPGAAEGNGALGRERHARGEGDQA